MLSQPPQDLRSDELVFLVRFTGEVFRKYEDYLEKITLYRQKIWTCKVTGKMGMTFEEALASECQAVEKLQQFPKDFMGPVLQHVQFSVLRLDELVSTIMKFYKDHFVPGDELVYLEGNSLLPCKVLRVIEEHIGGNIFGACEVGWLDLDKNITRMSVEPSDRLVRRKNPFTKAQLKSFIRESVRANMGRNAPWVVHEKLCHKYGISTEPPDHLKMFFAKQELSHKEASGSSKRLAVSLRP